MGFAWILVASFMALFWVKWQVLFVGLYLACSLSFDGEWLVYCYCPPTKVMAPTIKTSTNHIHSNFIHEMNLLFTCFCTIHTYTNQLLNNKQHVIIHKATNYTQTIYLITSHILIHKHIYTNHIHIFISHTQP